MAIEGKYVNVEELTHNKVNLQYPYIELNSLNDTTPLILSLLEKGDLKVVGSLQGQRRVLGSISESAYNIDKLLRTHDSVNYVSETGVREITTVVEYLEALMGWTL